MLSERLRIPSRNRSEGFIPVGALLGGGEVKIRKTGEGDKPARARKVPEMLRPRWGRRSMIYPLTGLK